MQKFAVYTMQRSFQVVTLTRIFRVEKIQHLRNKLLINQLFGVLQGDKKGKRCQYATHTDTDTHKHIARVTYLGAKIRHFDPSQEELVYDLNVRPRRLQNRLVFFRVIRYTTFTSVSNHSHTRRSLTPLSKAQ